MIEGVVENWREIEESLELAVLIVVRDEGLAKETSFCIGEKRLRNRGGRFEDIEYNKVVRNKGL